MRTYWLYKQQKNETESEKATVVVGTDSDRLVRTATLTQRENSIYMLVPVNANIFRKGHSRTELHDDLENIKVYQLFIHAIMGFNTTSAFFNKGPINRFKKL